MLRINKSIKKGKIYIKNKTLYSKDFVDEMLSSNYPFPIKVINNCIIVNNDTIYFPNDLDLNKEYIFNATDENQYHILTLKRINLSTINYIFNIYENEKLVYSNEGEANMNIYFFVDSYFPENCKTTEYYDATEYYNKKCENGVIFAIGIILDNNFNYRAYVYALNNNEIDYRIKTITLRLE